MIEPLCTVHRSRCPVEGKVHPVVLCISTWTVSLGMHCAIRSASACPSCGRPYRHAPCQTCSQIRERLLTGFQTLVKVPLKYNGVPESILGGRQMDQLP